MYIFIFLYIGNPKLISWQQEVTGWSWKQRLGSRVVTDCAQNPPGHWNSSWLLLHSHSAQGPPGRHSLPVLGWPVFSQIIIHTYGVWGRGEQADFRLLWVCICICYLLFWTSFAFPRICYHWITVVLLLTDHLGVWGRLWMCNLRRISMYLPPLDRPPGAV